MSIKAQTSKEYTRIRNCEKPVRNLLYILPFGCFMIMANIFHFQGRLLLWGILVSIIPFCIFMILSGLGKQARKREAAIKAAQMESKAMQGMFNEAVYQALRRMKTEDTCNKTN